MTAFGLGHATRSKKASFPWNQFSEAPTAYVTSLPTLGNNDRWMDPSKMTMKLLEKCIRYFKKRADDGHSPPITFVQSHIQEQQGRGSKMRKPKQDNKGKGKQSAVDDTEEEEDFGHLFPPDGDDSDLENHDPFPAKRSRRYVKSQLPEHEAEKRGRPSMRPSSCDTTNPDDCLAFVVNILAPAVPQYANLVLALRQTTHLDVGHHWIHDWITADA